MVKVTFRRISTRLLPALLASTTLWLSACTAPENATDGVDEADEVEIVTLYVGPEKTDCVGVGPQECLQVRYDPEDEYELFYSSIDGFMYEPGYDYELIVQKTPVENPPADASAIEWTLVDIVSQTPAATNP
ncbi:MAG: DUF4377 domain-containing protein [Leptolyngbyaceae cyanobacterium]